MGRRISDEEVITEGKWKRQIKSNAGNVVDLAVLTMGEKDRYWNIVLKKAIKDKYKKYRHENREGVRYWRTLSYPVEAFLSAIEIKVRVRGNKKRILKDIDNLHCLKNENSKFDLYAHS